MSDDEAQTTDSGDSGDSGDMTNVSYTFPPETVVESSTGEEPAAGPLDAEDADPADLSGESDRVDE